MTSALTMPLITVTGTLTESPGRHQVGEDCINILQEQRRRAKNDMTFGITFTELQSVIAYSPLIRP